MQNNFDNVMIVHRAGIQYLLNKWRNKWTDVVKTELDKSKWSKADLKLTANPKNLIDAIPRDVTVSQSSLVYSSPLNAP